MPRHPDFEKIYQAFMWRYCKGETECEEGKQIYYAWLKKLGLDDTKPYQYPQETREKFSWTEPYIQFLKEDEQAKYFKVEALFPLSSMNNNLYTLDELLRGARSLIGKQVNWSHTGELAPEVQIYDAEYEDDCVECVLRVAKGSKALDLIEKGQVLHVSIEADCLRGSELTPDGWTCKGLVFTGLALLTKDVLPGVPLTRIMPVEKLVESFKGITMQKEEKEEKAENKDPKLGSGKEAVTDSTSAEDLHGKAEKVLVAAAKDADVGDYEVLEKIEDLQGKYEALKSEIEQLKKPKEEPKQEPKKEPCKCLLTNEGMWKRFHELRSEGCNKEDAFRLLCIEIIAATSKKSQ